MVNTLGIRSTINVKIYIFRCKLFSNHGLFLKSEIHAMTAIREEIQSRIRNFSRGCKGKGVGSEVLFSILQCEFSS